MPAMRYVVLDTETTGKRPEQGHRVVEVGALLIEGRTIRRDCVFHTYINPQRPIPQEVVEIHGITDEKVKDKPRFAEIKDALLDFLQQGVLVIHNAPFDLRFLMYEYAHAGSPGVLDDLMVIDTLALARSRRFARCSLYALCDRFSVDRSRRTLHGALLDAELLAEVFLRMTEGQLSLDGDIRPRPAKTFASVAFRAALHDELKETAPLTNRPPVAVPSEDAQAHEVLMDRIAKACGGVPLWRQLEAEAR